MTRQVAVFKTIRNEDTRAVERVSDGFAQFHHFGVCYEEFESGAGNYSTAIIERANGTVETPPAEMIQFIYESPPCQSIAVDRDAYQALVAAVLEVSEYYPGESGPSHLKTARNALTKAGIHDPSK